MVLSMKKETRINGKNINQYGVTAGATFLSKNLM
jgi:hypothetical protein